MTTSIGTIADALIDLHHVRDPEADPSAEALAFSSVLSRLTELEVLTVTVNDETGEHSINVEQLLVAIAGIQYYLIEKLAEAQDVDPEAIRFDLRAFANSLDED